jgi:hypothetical protein
MKGGSTAITRELATANRPIYQTEPYWISLDRYAECQ